MNIHGYISHSTDSLPSDLKNIQSEIEIKEKKVKKLERIEEQVLKKLREIRDKNKALVSMRIQNLENKQRREVQLSVDKEEEESKREAIRTKRLQYRQNLEYGRMAVKQRNEEMARQVRLEYEKQKSRTGLNKEQRKSTVLPNIKAHFLKEINRREMFRKRRMHVSDDLRLVSELKLKINALDSKEKELVRRIKASERVKTHR